jgi:hypothetical protein
VKVRFEVPERFPLIEMFPEEEVKALFAVATETFPVKVWQFVVETHD